ncbi:MAG TPA: thiamine phosphate synthase [Thermoanaerobaculia bacterium]|nr:thiamine phosphate synthase [Thermoanaerobaculia bacterium]
MTLQRSHVPHIYALTPPSAGDRCQDVVEQLVAAGLQWIQVRAKGISDAELFQAVELIAAAMPAKVQLFVNDRADVALACSADGVHLGEHDLPPTAARVVAGDRKLLIGYSTHSLEAAVGAAADPAVDYIAIGPIFRSPTKNIRPPLGLEVLRQLRDKTDKPVIAIGGIDATNIRMVLDAGADSAAVISALYGDGGTIVENSRRLLESVEQRA